MRGNAGYSARRRRVVFVLAVALPAACSSSSSSESASDASAPDAAPSDAATDSGSSDSAIGFDAVAPTPPTDAPLKGLTLFDGWEDPRELAPPVNSIGWEDCSYISASGERLYFGYNQFDYYSENMLDSLMVDGPSRPGETRPGFEVFEATIADGGWNVAVSTVNPSDTTLSQAGEGVDDAEETMAFIQYSGPNPHDIFLSKKSGGTWGTPTLLPSPINTPCNEDNAALSRDGTKLYFDSTRIDALGTSCNAGSSPYVRTIYMSQNTGSGWSDPVALGGAPNGGSFHWQIYPREDPTMYWSGGDTDCLALGCVYRASLESDGGYGDRVLVAQPTAVAAASVGDVVAIGEVSITRDGHWMYFTYVEKTTSSDGGPDANVNIGVAHRP